MQFCALVDRLDELVRIKEILDDRPQRGQVMQHFISDRGFFSRGHHYSHESKSSLIQVILYKASKRFKLESPGCSGLNLDEFIAQFV